MNHSAAKDTAHFQEDPKYTDKNKKRLIKKRKKRKKEKPTTYLTTIK